MQFPWRLVYLIKEDIAQCANDPGIRKTLASQLKTNEESLQTCFSNCLAHFDYRLAEKITNFDECQAERNNFAGCFGKIVSEPLDWTMDWKAVLNERWIQFNPDKLVYNT